MDVSDEDAIYRKLEIQQQRMDFVIQKLQKIERCVYEIKIKQASHNGAIEYGKYANMKFIAIVGVLIAIITTFMNVLFRGI